MKVRFVAASIVLSLSILVIAVGNGLPQNYPNRPIRIIVPLPPGGGTDILARTIGQKLSEAWGQPVLVDNRPGAGTIIGAEMAAKSAPDGYTIYISGPQLAINQGLHSKLPYDVLKDFVSVTQLTSFSNVLVLHPSVPAKSVGELIALAKSKPGKLNYGSAGNGSSTHLDMELFKTMAGIDMVHIPYKGGAPAMLDLMGGRVSLMFDAVITSLPQIKAGKLRALGVSDVKRSPLMPDIPTVAEAGVPGFDAGVWIGVVAPTGTPKEIIHKLNAEMVKILRMPDMRERLLSEGFEPVGGTPEQFGFLLKEEIVKWTKVVKDCGVRVD